ncbi:MAG: hypothetical protein ACKO15_12625 [Burkholderiales bacterium]
MRTIAAAYPLYRSAKRRTVSSSSFGAAIQGKISLMVALSSRILFYPTGA